MRTAEQKHDSFTRQAQHWIDKLEELLEEIPRQGDTPETCQRQCIHDKIKKLEHAVSGLSVDDFNPWTCTDEDNEQYGRMIADGVYEFKEKDHHSDDENEVIEMTIDMAKYTIEQQEEAVSGYYPSIADVKDEYGDSWEWIVAECIFEQKSGLY